MAKRKNKKEMKEFLEGDLIARIIRVEQFVNSHFGKKLKPRETDFFKGLDKENRKSYNRYINRQKKKRLVKFSILMLPIFVVALSNIRLTGQAIYDVTNLSPVYLTIVPLGAFLGILTFLIMENLFEKFSSRKLSKHGKYLIRKIRLKKN